MNTRGAYRQSDGTRIAPATVGPSFDAPALNAHNARPLLLAAGNPVDGEKSIVPPVTLLLCFRCPLDVARLIVAIIVPTIQGVFGGWPRPDFSEELVKRCKSKFNSTGPVNMVASVRDGFTASLGMGVGSVLGTVRHAMFSKHRTNTLCMETPAGRARSRSQGMRSHWFNRPTNALAVPSTAAHVPKNGPTSEGSILEVDKSWISWNRLKNNSIFVVVHSVFSCQKMAWTRLAKDSQGLWRAAFILPNTMQMCIKYHGEK